MEVVGEERRFTIELCDPQGVLEREIADPRLKREDVALTYAMSLESTEVDWSAVNHAIMDRWSMSGLKWIKTRAWKLAETRSPTQP